MRNLSILAFIGFLFLFTGCGVVRNVASTLNHEICEKSYNKFVCPTVSEPAHTPLCYGVSVRTTAGVDNFAHTDQGPFCKKLQNEATRKAFQSKPGTTCAIKGKGKFQKVVCAGFHHAGGILLILLTLLWGRGLRDLMVASVENEDTRRPFDGMWEGCRVMIIACIGAVVLLALTTNAYSQPCVNKAYTISQPSDILECEMTLSTPESNMRYTLTALDLAQDKVCNIHHPNMGIVACYDLYDEARALFKARAALLMLKEATRIVDINESVTTPTPCGANKHLCASVGWDKASGIGLFFSFIISLLLSRRKTREEWFGFETLLYRETRNAVWAIEDELYKARWIERVIEAAITLAAFSFGGLVLGITSTFLAQKRYGWASIFCVFVSVLLWGSALEWILFVLKALTCFLSNTEEGFRFVRWALHQRWKRQL